MEDDMFNFKPKAKEQIVNTVPFFEEATAANGWQGQTTGQTVETLKAKIHAAIGRLGGIVVGIEEGSFMERPGYRIHYVIETPEGKQVPGYIDVAALPLKPMQRVYHYRNRANPEAARMDKSLRMALFNVVMCLDSLWKLQRLSPGFAPLMPFMIVQKGINLTQIWSSSSSMKALMPPSDTFKPEESETIEGEARDI